MSIRENKCIRTSSKAVSILLKKITRFASRNFDINYCIASRPYSVLQTMFLDRGYFFPVFFLRDKPFN